MEGRDAAKGKPREGNALRTQSRPSALTKLAWVGQKAATDKETKLNNLLSHLKVPLLREAYERLKRHAAPGVDGMTWDEYGRGLDARLTDLEGRLHRGSYHPPPVRRVHIPKPDGRRRPLGLPTVEDKIVQQAVRMILEPIYEPMFRGFSYGFRPGRSAHDALDTLATVIVKEKTNWVLDADIRSFFDTIDHGWMKRFVEHRVADGRLIRLLMKWLKAGVMEGGERHEVEAGTPQGGILSPLLANIYLHYALDLWADQWRRRHARQEVYIVRYADDFVMGFKDERDAQAMRSALRERLREFGLELHEDKTRVLRFGRYAREQSEALDQRVETFDFLGFTHIVGIDRKNGWFQLHRHTSRKKRQRKLAELAQELRRRRHEDPRVTHAWLSSVLRGYDQYYGVPTNERTLKRFRRHLHDAWVRQLQRRSQRGRWSVEDLKRFDRRLPLPQPAIRHPWPEKRFRSR
jgi:group II intron reverse transcriptase/maturase